MASYAITISIIVITCVLSFGAFNNPKIMADLIFHPPSIQEKNQWYRFITSGFLHANIGHLAFNMLTLYFFGRLWEIIYVGQLGVEKYMYILFYILAIIVSDIPSFIKHKNDYNYRSLGASGAVSAVVFSAILLLPWETIYIFFIPIPAIIYAILFLGYSVYMDKRGGDNINHKAHFWGAIFGIAFTLVLKPEVGKYFIEALQHPKFNF
jgi:membrane associated rhomboid family serine protease